jgi:hypothetical protein
MYDRDAHKNIAMITCTSKKQHGREQKVGATRNVLIDQDIVEEMLQPKTT